MSAFVVKEGKKKIIKGLILSQNSELFNCKICHRQNRYICHNQMFLFVLALRVHSEEYSYEENGNTEYTIYSYHESIELDENQFYETNSEEENYAYSVEYYYDEEKNKHYIDYQQVNVSTRPKIAAQRNRSPKIVSIKRTYNPVRIISKPKYVSLENSARRLSESRIRRGTGRTESNNFLIDAAGKAVQDIADAGGKIVQGVIGAAESTGKIIKAVRGGPETVGKIVKAVKGDQEAVGKIVQCVQGAADSAGKIVQGATDLKRTIFPGVQGTLDLGRKIAQGTAESGRIMGHVHKAASGKTIIGKYSMLKELTHDIGSTPNATVKKTIEKHGDIKTTITTTVCGNKTITKIEKETRKPFNAEKDITFIIKTGESTKIIKRKGKLVSSVEQKKSGEVTRKCYISPIDGKGIGRKTKHYRKTKDGETAVNISRRASLSGIEAGPRVLRQTAKHKTSFGVKGEHTLEKKSGDVTSKGHGALVLGRRYIAAGSGVSKQTDKRKTSVGLRGGYNLEKGVYAGGDIAHVQKTKDGYRGFAVAGVVGPRWIAGDVAAKSKTKRLPVGGLGLKTGGAIGLRKTKTRSTR